MVTNSYNASQVIKRAKDLADIQNTDFLTYDELLRYINDSWNQAYQALINKGDKQFVKEAELSSVGSGLSGYTAYELPDDLYQLASVRDSRGYLFTRHTDSEGDSASGTYDVVNNTLRIYGNHYSRIIVTYYMTPTYISFPDKPINVNIEESVVSAAGNNVLLSDGTIKNLITGDIVGTITLEEGKQYILGNGHIAVISETDHTLTYINYKGSVITTITTEGTFTTLYDEDFNIIYQTLINGKYTAPYSFNTEVLNITDWEENGYPKFVVRYYGYWLYYNESSRTLNVYEEDEDEILIETELPFTPVKIIPTMPFDNKPAFLISDTKGKVYSFVLKGNEFYYDLIANPPILTALLSYGPLVSNGTDLILTSAIPDTELNFPNELYFSLLSCDLALRFAMKMNANTDGLNNLYQNMWNEYLNTLSQTADYTRIKNVY